MIHPRVRLCSGSVVVQEGHEEELQCQYCLNVPRAAVEVDYLQQFRHLFPLDMGMVFGVVLALFSLLLGRRVLVSRHPPLEDCVVECLCQDLLHPKCLVVTASLFDNGDQLLDLLPASSVPLQLPKWCHCRNDLGQLVLQLPALVGEGEPLEGPFAVQEPVFGVLKGLGGSFLTISASLPSLEFSGVSACLSAPGPDVVPFLPCCAESPSPHTDEALVRYGENARYNKNPETSCGIRGLSVLETW